MSVLAHIARVFPPPRLLTLPSVGVDVSESSLKYMQLRPHGDSHELLRWGDIPLSEGAVERGSIVEKAELVRALREVRLMCKTPYIRASLPEERAYLFETTIEPGLSETDTRNLLEFRMEENVPISPRDAFFDYTVVPNGGDEALLHIGVSVYAKETIVNYADACREAEVMPLSFEVEADAIARASVPADGDDVSMILDIGKMRTGLGIVHQHTLLYTSTIDIGGKQFDDALLAHRGAQTEEELIALKNEQGLLQTGGDDEVCEILVPSVSALRDEIMTRLTYWNTRPERAHGRDIQRIILCGGSVNMAGLPEYLTEALGIETERVDVWRNVFTEWDTVPPITRRYSYGYATAIGLALRDRFEDARYE